MDHNIAPTPWKAEGTVLTDANGNSIASAGNNRRITGEILRNSLRIAAGAPELLAAARPLVAMTLAEARKKAHLGMRFMFCQHDALNPCWNANYSPTGWGEHGAGKHWGGGDACPECNLRAAIFKTTGSTS